MTHKSVAHCLAGVALAAALLPAAHAAPVLYGVTGAGGAASSLYTIDPFTGATTLIGATGFSHVTGIDFDPTSGTLYGVISGSAAGGGTDRLITINTATGAGTVVGPTGTQIPDITIGPDGIIRGWSEPSTDDAIVIDKTTGAVTPTVVALSTARTGIATLDATHIYMRNFTGILYSVDVGTGALVVLSTMSTAGGAADNLLENMPTGDDLLTGDRDVGGTQWYTIDPTTGLTTALGLSSGIEFSGIAFATPEPGILALLGLGLAGIGISRRRRA